MPEFPVPQVGQEIEELRPPQVGQETELEYELLVNEELLVETPFFPQVTQLKLSELVRPV
ncbi:MAG: hypothetical protein FWE67_02585 [Planctomycetaceae bacterium]|nr:hypothetical protein [Planctomycetaceae bacterium]